MLAFMAPLCQNTSDCLVQVAKKSKPLPIFLKKNRIKDCQRD